MTATRVCADAVPETHSKTKSSSTHAALTSSSQTTTAINFSISNYDRNHQFNNGTFHFKFPTSVSLTFAKCRKLCRAVQGSYLVQDAAPRGDPSPRTRDRRERFWWPTGVASFTPIRLTSLGDHYDSLHTSINPCCHFPQSPSGTHESAENHNAFSHSPRGRRCKKQYLTL